MVTRAQKSTLTDLALLYVDLNRALVSESHIYLAVEGRGDTAHVVIKEDNWKTKFHKLFQPSAFEFKHVLDVLHKEVKQITAGAPSEYHAQCVRVVTRLVDLLSGIQKRKIANDLGIIDNCYSRIGKIWDENGNCTTEKELKLFLEKRVQIGFQGPEEKTIEKIVKQLI